MSILSLSLPLLWAQLLIYKMHPQGQTNGSWHPCWRSCEAITGPNVDENAWQAHLARPLPFTRDGADSLEDKGQAGEASLRSQH